MHPYHFFLHRGPSRIFWFLVGAGATSWWHYSSSMRDHRAKYYPCVMHNRPVQDAHSGNQSQDATQSRPPWGSDRIPAGWYQQRDWEQDKERLRDLQKRAGETVVDLSESTLDSILAGAESLKAKLAELRAERERFEAEKKAPQPDA